ncbi:MAG: hypothetical protein JNL11_18230 [Bdellovibrionaceae bacterium]|nr:hypothetical protein [Pseudobdellovibrionaceae bacterium]
MEVWQHLVFIKQSTGQQCADEPTSSLDEANAFQVIELLIKASQDKTLIVVSHDHRIEKYFTSIRPFKEIVS